MGGWMVYAGLGEAELDGWFNILVSVICNA